MITYHYARDKHGQIININAVTSENLSNYYCIGCGKEMSAVLGDIREHHFRHKGNYCSKESYLHQLGKEHFKKMFESQKEFLIKYYVKPDCDKSRECILENKTYCLQKKLKTIDLKQLYDTCEKEVVYKGYRADLMLSSKKHPEREPIFIEIFFTHECEQEKKKSGIKIIEILIEKEEDLLHELVEEDSPFFRFGKGDPYPFEIFLPVRFYNFQRTFKIKQQSNCREPLGYSIIDSE